MSNIHASNWACDNEASHLLQELLENVADPKEFGKRGEPLFFGSLLFIILIFFPPTFFKVSAVTIDADAYVCTLTVANILCRLW